MEHTNRGSWKRLVKGRSGRLPRRQKHTWQTGFSPPNFTSIETRDESYFIRLLAVSIDGAYYLPCYDNNGNITAYVNEQGAVVAQYTYDAFGATTTQSGTMAEAFPHRFSTKYHDPETGLYYYGRRFYSPEQHRWLNRDPIEEEGGINLYAFCRNNPLKFIDPHGFSVWFAAGNITAYEKDILQELVDDHNLRVKKAKAYFDKFKLREASKKYTRIFKWNGNVVTSDVFFKRLDEETAILKSTSFKTLDGDMKEITELVNKHTYSYDQTVYTHETTIETYLSNDGSNAATEYRYIVEYSKEPETPIDTVAAAVKKIPIKKGTLVHNACFTDPEHKLKSSLNRKWANKGAENDKVHYGYKKLKGENNKCEIYFDTFEYYTVETTGDAPPIMGFETIE